MDVTLLVTKTDFCTHNLECELKNIGIECHTEYIENHPELVSEYQIRHSPNIFVDGHLVFRALPSLDELKAYFGRG